MATLMHSNGRDFRLEHDGRAVPVYGWRYTTWRSQPGDPIRVDKSPNIFGGHEIRNLKAKVSPDGLRLTVTYEGLNGHGWYAGNWSASRATTDEPFVGSHG